MSANLSFGERLKQRRKALDLTQTALAQRVGCAVSTIKRVETGKLRPSQALARRLADQLQLPRNQTLQQAIAWSYNLLSALEQALFRQLGVFQKDRTILSGGRKTGDGYASTCDTRRAGPLCGCLRQIRLLERYA